MPTPEQMDELAAEAARQTGAPTVPPSPAPGPTDMMPEAYWDSVLRDRRGRAVGVPIQQRRLAEIPRHLLRVWCRRCDRTVEIQTTDAARLYGPHAVWKDVGRRLLDDGCRTRTGSHEDDGCWPAFEER